MKVPRRFFMLLAVSLCHIASVQPLLTTKVHAWANVRESSRQSEQTEDTVQQAEALLALSAEQNLENHALALETAQQALALWQTTGNNDGIARAYYQIAGYYTAQSNLSEAVQNYESALQIWHDLDKTSEQADILIQLGQIENRKGEWQNSISFFTRAQDLIAGQDNPFLTAQIALGLGYIFNETGLPEIGLIQNQRALTYYRQTPTPDDDAMALVEIGISYYHLGVSYSHLEDYTEALTYLQQALASFKPDDELYAALCHQFLGKIYGSMGEYTAAFQHLETALPIYLSAGNTKEAAEVRGLMGQVYQQQGRLEPAQQYYQQALATFIKLSDRINQAAIYYALGQVELKKRNYDAAESYLRQSIEVTENIRRVPTSSDLTAAFSATVYERYEKYIECLMRKHEAQPTQGLVVRAFETSELARARSLAELLRATETNLVPGLDPQLAEKEKSLRQSLRVKEDYEVTLLSQRVYREEELIALEAELERLKAEYKQVTEIIRARYPSYGQITQPVAWDLQRIQEQVIADDQTVLLEYSLGEDQSYVWAVTRNSLKSYKLPAQKLINEAAQKVHKLLATPPRMESTDELTPALQELSRMVLSPAASELNKRRVIIVADGALNYIPFQVLPTSSTSNEVLADTCEVSNNPSASILGEVRQEAARRQPAAKLLAAFGDPVFAANYAQLSGTNGSEQLAALPAMGTAHLQNALRDIELKGDSYDPSVIQPLFYAKRELAYLRDVAAGGETFMATDFDANREQLLKTDLTQYAILHFATHGILDPKRPELSGLVLSTINREGQEQNGFVGLQDIYQLRAPVNLVVLSACQTGLGKDVRGEGLLSLTRGFMYAGASTVVASLWNVDDEATAELMRQFYENMLQKKMTPAAALRAAQNSIRQQPDWRSPYYWAGFTLQGEYQQVIKSTPAASVTPTKSKIIVGGALLALLASGVWAYRRRRLKAAQASG